MGSQVSLLTRPDDPLPGNFTFLLYNVQDFSSLLTAMTIITNSYKKFSSYEITHHTTRENILPFSDFAAVVIVTRRHSNEPYSSGDMEETGYWSAALRVTYF